MQPPLSATAVKATSKQGPGQWGQTHLVTHEVDAVLVEQHIPVLVQCEKGTASCWCTRVQWGRVALSLTVHWCIAMLVHTCVIVPRQVPLAAGVSSDLVCRFVLLKHLHA